MSSPIPYEFDDHDIVSPDYSVALLARYPTAMLGRQFAPVDADDCAPGLDYPPILGLSIAAVIDHDGRVVHEVRIDEEPVYDTLLWCEIRDAAHELDGFGHHEAATALLLWLDTDRDDRPSPGDDITREAFDAMDGYRRSNDSGGGGTL